MGLHHLWIASIPGDIALPSLGSVLPERRRQTKTHINLQGHLWGEAHRARGLTGGAWTQLEQSGQAAGKPQGADRKSGRAGPGRGGAPVSSWCKGSGAGGSRFLPRIFIEQMAGRQAGATCRWACLCVALEARGVPVGLWVTCEGRSHQLLRGLEGPPRA